LLASLSQATYGKVVPKLVFNPAQPAKREPEVVTATTDAKRKADRAKMSELSERILAGFRSRSKYQRPRKEAAEPWRDYMT
jgi:hypothetical protein